MTSQEVAERLAEQLATRRCESCRGGLDPYVGGPCKVCKGTTAVPLDPDARRRWVDTARGILDAAGLEGARGGHVMTRKG